jgi:hypothetical protein
MTAESPSGYKSSLVAPECLKAERLDNCEGYGPRFLMASDFSDAVANPDFRCKDSIQIDGQGVGAARSIEQRECVFQTRERTEAPLRNPTTARLDESVRAHSPSHDALRK